MADVPQFPPNELRPAEQVPLSCWMLGHVMRVEDPRRGLLGPRVCKRKGCTHREAGMTWPAGVGPDAVKLPPPPCRCGVGDLFAGRQGTVDIADCPEHRDEYRKNFESMLAGNGPLPRAVPDGATSVEVSAPKPRRETKFTVSIYCGNCHTVGDYQFRKGTILHAANDFTWAEYRNGTPTDRKATIRLNDRTNGTLVECRFCKCSTALTIRERNGETS